MRFQGNARIEAVFGGALQMIRNGAASVLGPIEHYVQCFRRIQLCRDNGLSPELIAQATGHSLALVQEYLDLIKEFRIPPLPDPERKEDSRSKKKRKQR
jgi:hypothetical protein